MSTIDKGIFELESNAGETKLCYTIFMYRIFIVVTLMAGFIAFNDFFFAKIVFTSGIGTPLRKVSRL